MSPRLALALLAITSSCQWACGGAQVQETQATMYAAAELVCVKQATSRDAGIYCIDAIKSVFCGPGGVFYDSGACPDGGAP
jgi:hypothetical protein